MARDVLARHNVVATYPRLEEARAALSALERAGGVAGGVAGAHLHEDWELTYQSVREGKVLVAVHGDDPDALEGAVKLLREEGAEMIDRYDHEGRRVDIAG